MDYIPDMLCPTPSPPPAKPRNYVEPETLRALTLGARSRSKPKRERSLVALIAVWEKIARGCNRRYRFVRGAAVDDYAQECLLDLLAGGLPNADADGNLFSYYTRICQNCGRKIANQRAAEAAAFEAYRAELIATHIANGFDPTDAPPPESEPGDDDRQQPGSEEDE